MPSLTALIDSLRLAGPEHGACQALELVKHCTCIQLSAMNARHEPEVLIGLPDEQLTLQLETLGVLRYVWVGQFAETLIEVIDGVPYVNGERVEPADRSKS